MAAAYNRGDTKPTTSCDERSDSGVWSRGRFAMLKIDNRW